MHVVFRESHGLEEVETPTDLGQSPAELVVLSFSDSDLSAFAEGWHRAREHGAGLPRLRLANIAALKHPVSVDTYVERTLSGAKAILVRLIGGRSYWSYGLDQMRALAEEKGIVLAVLPGDGRPDPSLDDVSTVPRATLERLNALCREGGAVAAQAALAQMALAAGLYAGPVAGSKTLAPFGCWSPDAGARSAEKCGECAALDCAVSARADRPLVLVVFYRAYLAAADLEPIRALFADLSGRGYAVRGVYATSLKDRGAAQWLRARIEAMRPAAIVNATAFSGRGAEGWSPLDAAGVPVFQVALSTSSRPAWQEAERGLSPADLAMHVVLPEVDGRLFAGVVSFKEAGQRDEELEFSLTRHVPDPARVRVIADRVSSWIEMARRPVSQRRPAVILSTYPGKDWQVAHAVGLDGIASAEAILEDLCGAGYDTGTGGNAISFSGSRSDKERRDPEIGVISWPISLYRDALERLPSELRDQLAAAWGDFENDPTVQDGAFRFRAERRGKVLVALQPERGQRAQRDDDYHDLSRVPCHGYVAFYLWLQEQADAMIHVGAHGTLEWLPGKSVALCETCWPEALIGSLPVVYPFIVNDPGEAAQAKRRIGAVTLGHVPPPLAQAVAPDRFTRLEALLDEFSNADGLDPRRRDRLQADIRSEAQALGVEDDLGLDRAASTAEAVTRIDRFVCDIKESQFGDGLHVWGQDAAGAERPALLAALDGRRIEAGPSGSPFRGRSDVLPTGRNLYTTDPRSVPTRAAYAQGVTLAEELVRRHLQEEGDYPKGLIVDLWGSATMRTAGEEFAMALHLLGARPVWDKGSERVSGVEILPIAELERPRIDVTLRVSGLFRDVFPTLTGLFAQAVRALSERDEAPDWNPYVGAASARVYGPAPGSYGLGMHHAADNLGAEGRERAGAEWLRASAWAMDGDHHLPDAAGLAERVSRADSFVHLQDLPETDLLLAADYAAHEAGFAAAKSVVGGGTAALYHLDNTDPARPRARSLPEEVARVVVARAANPAWIAGMMRHGFRGAAEIAATLDHMAAFANLADAVSSHLFDAFWDATLGEDAVVHFMAEANPEALAAMRCQFEALAEAGLWVTRRNSIRAELGA